MSIATVEEGGWREIATVVNYSVETRGMLVETAATADEKRGACGY